MSEVTYSKKNDEIECVRYEKSRKTYLPHTHTNHLTIGYIEDGKVCITIDGESCIYTQGDEFRIMPNVLHEVKSADENPYSMMVMPFSSVISSQSSPIGQSTKETVAPTIGLPLESTTRTRVSMK